MCRAGIENNAITNWKRRARLCCSSCARSARPELRGQSKGAPPLKLENLRDPGDRMPQQRPSLLSQALMNRPLCAKTFT